MNIEFNNMQWDTRDGKLIYIGSGSGRAVYDMGNGYVIKAARNKKGLAQNRVEHTIYMEEQSPLLAQIIDAAENYDYVIMRKAEHIYSRSYIQGYLRNVMIGEYPAGYELQRIMDKYGLILADIRRSSSWGLIDDKLVLIDYGFTWGVKRTYYGYNK